MRAASHTEGMSMGANMISPMGAHSQIGGDNMSNFNTGA